MKLMSCNSMPTEQEEVMARQIALAVMADVRTVRRFLRGQKVRGIIGMRIRAEVERRQMHEQPKLCVSGHGRGG